MSSIEPLPLQPPEKPREISATHAEAIEAAESRNLLVLAVHHIVFRIAWIFKTESVIMPAFMDTIAGPGWLRGCLPVLNRIGQSVPALMFSEQLRRTRRKKWTLLTTCVLMAVPFLLLSVVWFSIEQKRQAWLPGGFLVLYFLFFCVTGLNQLSFGTLQGKLIRPHRRGKLMSTSGMFGALCSIVCAWFLLERWLELPDGGFGYIFGFTGIGFVVAGLFAFGIVEPADNPEKSTAASSHHFRNAWKLFRDDHDFRRLAIVTMLVLAAQLLFPHYQALARNAFDAGGVDLMVWVVAQNAGMGIFSLIAGALADRFGNRLVLRIEILLSALTPLLAVFLTTEWFDDGASLFWIAFFLLGLTPVIVKTLVNYSLEISDPSKHPRYISTLKLSMAIPFFLSPVLGLLVDVLGFSAVFAFVSAVMAMGGLLTFFMAEPRHRL